VVALLVRRAEEALLVSRGRLARGVLLRLRASHGEAAVPETVLPVRDVVVARAGSAALVSVDVFLSSRDGAPRVLRALVLVLPASARKASVDVVEAVGLQRLDLTDRGHVLGVERLDRREGLRFDDRHARRV